MAHFTSKAMKITAFCLPLSYYLSSVCVELDKPSEDAKYMDDDESRRDYFLKYNIFLNNVDRFFEENPKIYPEEELKEKIFDLFT